MRAGIRAAGTVGMIAATFAAASAQTFNFNKVNPRGTYLRDSQWEPGATILELHLDTVLASSLTHGTQLLLEIRTVGWFNRAYDNPAAHNISNEAVGVFAASNALDSDWSKQFRVGAPIEAGEDFYTLPTWEGNKATDIPEDFRIGPDLLQIVLPTTATHLMLTPFDNGFYNNVDDFSMPGADPRGFGVEWRIVQVSSVPEPSGLVLLSLGAASLVRRRLRRRR